MPMVDPHGWLARRQMSTCPEEGSSLGVALCSETLDNETPLPKLREFGAAQIPDLFFYIVQFTHM